MSLSDESEKERLHADRNRTANWKRWGPYLAERQWGTVREDYSERGDNWEYFDFNASHLRAYRWGEDGLLGICDRECRLCFAVALWNEADPILKERLFGLTNHQGNHGEDVKEIYYYLDSTPTHSYMKALYKYPQRAFPYEELLDENGRRGRDQDEYELTDTGAFKDNCYFDVQIEYAKAAPDHILISLEVTNRGVNPATLHLLPTIWFRNTWAWGRKSDGYWSKPNLSSASDRLIVAEHESLGRFALRAEIAAEQLFTDNETNNEKLFGSKNHSAFVKDGFHDYLIKGKAAINPEKKGTKAAFHYKLDLAGGEKKRIKLRLYKDEQENAGSNLIGNYASGGDIHNAASSQSDQNFPDFDEIVTRRKEEADSFYDSVLPMTALERKDRGPEMARIMRQAYAGLLWNKQFYHYVVDQWLEGDPNGPPPTRVNPINRRWPNIFNRDIILMPDKWEYPWYAIWDLAFHTVVMAKLDGDMAKEQLILFLREWYMHHSGQLPAYEFDFSDVNPPVHAWAAFRVYKMTAPRGERDTVFLARVFQKLLLNFTWWVNRKDIGGNDLFGGGFLGLDNIGVFDRSRGEVPFGGKLEQADGTAWMSFYCTTMLGIALELSASRPAYDDIASKFFEHFIQISDAMHKTGGCGLWCEEDGFYYDRLLVDSGNSGENDQTNTSQKALSIPLRLRSIVGLIPLLAVEILNEEHLKKLPGFHKRMEWFINNRGDLDGNIALTRFTERGECRLLSLLDEERLRSLLKYMLDENEFLSPYGIRSLSKVYENEPYVFSDGELRHEVRYVPGNSDSASFGGNSNWRGPIWLPINFLIVEALERYHRFYGPEFKVECPTGSGRLLNLEQVADELAARLGAIFTEGNEGLKPWQGEETLYGDEAFKNLELFYEYFHAESGKGLGASHQTGWTALITRIFDIIAKR